MDYLVGYTGFVGSNLAATHNFEGLFNTKNIEKAFGVSPDLLVYSGVPAEMFLANKNPEEDRKVIDNAINNIKQIAPKKIVLISTIGVYENPVRVNENTDINEDYVLPYGKNRLLLEKWVEENIKEHLIVRLPGLYGMNLKKNFLYDFINIVPSMLSEDKYIYCSEKSVAIKINYEKQENGFYKCNTQLKNVSKKQLKEEFIKLGFTALDFTDSRGIFQYYNLNRLWSDICCALENKVKKINIAVEPITIQELYHYLTGDKFDNILNKPAPHFDFYTIHADIFNKQGNYILEKEEILVDIKRFVEKEMLKEGD